VLREGARKHLEDQHSGATPRTVNYATITNAFVSGDAAVISMAAEHAKTMLPVMEKRLKLGESATAANYLNLVAATSADGTDPRPRLERFLAAKPDKTPEAAVLRWIARSILDGGKPAAAPRLAKSAGWLAKITQIEAADALDLVLVPDHPNWVDMQPFVLPLALLLATETGQPLALFTRDGGHPERRGTVLYERATPRPAVNAQVEETDPATWQGFDAIERKDEKLFVYHYLDQRWDAPIAFQPDIDAVPFLKQIPLSWQLVEKTVAPKVWQSMQADSEAKRAVHVLARDPAKVPVAKDALENLDREYSIEVVVMDYRKI
jgi:hypothetical protein